MYNAKCTRLRKIKAIVGNRQTAVAARYKSNGICGYSVTDQDYSIDTVGHGTCVAGVIGAIGDNGIGITAEVVSARLTLRDQYAALAATANAERSADERVVASVPDSELRAAIRAISRELAGE